MLRHFLLISCFVVQEPRQTPQTPTSVSGEATEQFSFHLSEGVFFFHIQGSKACYVWDGRARRGVQGFSGTSNFFWLTLFLARFLNIFCFCTLVFHMYLCCSNLNCALCLLLYVSGCVYPERHGMQWCACATSPLGIYFILITVPWLDH